MYEEDDTAGFTADWAKRVLDSAGQLAAAQAVWGIEAVSAADSLLARLERSNGLERQHVTPETRRGGLTAASTDEARASTAKSSCMLSGMGRTGRL